MHRLAEQLDQANQREEAQYWYRRAAELGVTGQEARPRGGRMRTLFEWAKENW